MGYTLEEWQAIWERDKNKHHIVSGYLIIMVDGQGCEHDARNSSCQDGGCNPITGYPKICSDCGSLIHLEYVTNEETITVCAGCGVE